MSIQIQPTAMTRAERLLAAFEECNIAALAKAPNFTQIAAKHALNRVTLSRRWRSARSSETPAGPRTGCELLNEPQREVLFKRMDFLARRNIWPTMAIIRNLAAEILGNDHPRPGKCWAQRFVKRYSQRCRCIIVSGMEKSRHTAEYAPVFEHFFDLVSTHKLREAFLMPELARKCMQKVQSTARSYL